jgi:hypothetical protein
MKSFYHFTFVLAEWEAWCRHKCWRTPCRSSYTKISCFCIWCQCAFRSQWSLDQKKLGIPALCTRSVWNCLSPSRLLHSSNIPQMQWAKYPRQCWKFWVPSWIFSRLFDLYLFLAWFLAAPYFDSLISLAMLFLEVKFDLRRFPFWIMQIEARVCNGLAEHQPASCRKA